MLKKMKSRKKSTLKSNKNKSFVLPSFSLKTVAAATIVLLAALFVAYFNNPTSFTRVLGITTPATYYVSTAGSDTNNGSISAPFKTFTKAQSVATAGDTVYFRQGTYPYMVITKSGAAGAYLTFAAYPGEKVIVDGTGGEASIYLKQTSYVEVNGFEVIHASTAWFSGIHVRGANVTGSDYTITGSSNNRIINNIAHDNINGTQEIEGIQTINSSYNIIQGNTAYNNYYTGIGVEAQPGVPAIGNQIINNVAYNNTGVPGNEGNADGIHAGGDNLRQTLISGNTSYGNGDDGIDTWNSFDNIVEKNISHDNRGLGDGNGFKMGGKITGGNNIVRYNISYNNKANGFDSNGSGGNQYYNNVAYANGTWGFEDGWRGTDSLGCSTGTSRCVNTYKNNIGFNNTNPNFSAGAMTQVSDNNLWYSSNTGSAFVAFDYSNYSTLSAFSTASKMGLDQHSLSANPLFISPSAFDFHLQSSSPAIDKGANVGLTSDFSGAVVPAGAAPDMGAFEYGTSASSPVPSASPIASPTPSPVASPVPTPSPVVSPSPVASPVPSPSPVLDTEAPAVTITAPVAGQVLPKNTFVNINVTATDNVKVTKVEVVVNGSVTCTATTATSSCKWKVPNKAGVTYTIEARAYDAAGNVGKTSITVTAN